MMTAQLTPDYAAQLCRWWDITTDPLARFAKQQLAARFVKPTQASQRQALGRQVCDRVQTRLEAMGYQVDQTTHKKSFDLWVNDILHVEVKAAHWTSNGHRGRFQAHLGKNQLREADLLIFGCKNGVWHYYIIPTAEITSQSTLDITSYDVRAYKGKYARYLEAWTMVETGLATAARNRPRQLPFPEVTS